MGLGIKASAPDDFATRADALVLAYRSWLRRTEAGLSLSQKVRRGFAQVYRSKGERYQIAAYYSADFSLDVGGHPLAQAG
jgi:hypothetical protein